MPDQPVQPQQSPSTPPPVEDVFAEIDQQQSATIQQPQSEPTAPTAPVTPQAQETPAPATPVQPATAQLPTTGQEPTVVSHEGRFGDWFRELVLRIGRGTKIRLIVIGGAIVVIALVIGILLFVRSRQNNTPADDTTNINQVTPVNTNTSQPAIPPNQVNSTDIDRDGLLNTEEETIHTDPERVDTDEDGLTDRQEVRIYQTNPTLADTDGDKFSDGDEVRHFYNPNGKGKMIDVLDEIDKYNTESQNQ